MKIGAIAIVLLLGTVVPSPAQSSFTGTWRADAPAWTAVLSQKGNAVTGRVSACSSLPVEIYDGRVNGSALTFKCDNLDRNITMTFTGTLNGDAIEFTWTRLVRSGPTPPANAAFGAAAPARFVARRVDEDGPVELAAALNVFDRGVKAEGNLLLPSRTRRVSAVIVALRYGLGYQLEGDQRFRALSESLGVAVVFARISNISQTAGLDVVRSAGIGGADALLALLRQFAQQSGHQELADAPLLLWGHSAAGSFATTFAALHPTRTIGFVRYHSAGAGLPGVDGPVSRMPGLLLSAGSDDSRVPMEALVKDRRASGSPWTFGIEPNATHGDWEDLRKANDLIISWISAVIRFRVSPTGGALREMTDQSGWLGHLATRQNCADGRL